MVRALRRDLLLLLVIVSATVALLIAVHRWGEALERGPARLWLRWIPLTGHLVWRWQPWLLGALALGAAGAWWGPVLAARVRWSVLLSGTGLASLAWSVLVALGQGWRQLSEPLTTRYEYVAGVPALRELGWAEYVRTFTERLPSYPTHVKGHPPGIMGVLWLLDRVGHATAGGLAAVLVVAGSTAVVPVLLAARRVGGEEVARKAAPFLVFTPAVILMVTSADALLTAMAAWTLGVAFLALARAGRASLPLAVVAGALAGVGLHLSYGLLPMLAIPLPWAVARRRMALVGPAILGLLVATGPWLAGGFRWWDGLEATREAYASGAAGTRPYGYFLVTNPVVFAVILGPAVVAGLWVLGRRPHAVGWLVWPTLAVLVAVDLSGLSKGEVERIWLPFVPWLALGTGVLVADWWPGRARWWLAAQVGVTLVLQQAVAWKW